THASVGRASPRPCVGTAAPGADSQIGHESLKVARQLAQTLGVRHQLLERLLVDLSQCLWFARNGFFEGPNTLIRRWRIFRRDLLLRVLPLTKREAETIQLRLESTQALFKARIVFVHRVVAMIHKNGSRVTRDRMRERGFGLEVGLQT